MRAPFSTLHVGVTYRIHPDQGPDFMGRFQRKITFGDGDVRYIADHLLVPYMGSVKREVPGLMRSVNPATHTFYVTAQNMWVSRIIAAKTGRLVQPLLVTRYF